MVAESKTRGTEDEEINWKGRMNVLQKWKERELKERLVSKPVEWKSKRAGRRRVGKKYNGKENE